LTRDISACVVGGIASGSTDVGLVRSISSRLSSASCSTSPSISWKLDYNGRYTGFASIWDTVIIQIHSHVITYHAGALTWQLEPAINVPVFKKYDV